MQRGDALFLDATLVCRRNRLCVRSVLLRRDKRAKALPETHSFPQLAPPRGLTAGNHTQSMFLSDRVAVHNREAGPSREVCWIDAEDDAHCKPLTKDMLEALPADSRL